MDNKIILGVLALLILSSGVIYITFMDNARIRVDEDKSTFYVPHEDYSWIWTVSGREYNSIFDGTSKMNRDVSNIKVEEIVSNESITIKRTTPYIRGPVIIDTYEFEPNSSDIEYFPYSHQVEVINGSDFFYRYEVRDLDYSGETRKLTDETELSFGKNMKVTLEPDYRWAWVYKEGIVKAQYDVDSDYEVFNLRLFDPEGDVGYEFLMEDGNVTSFEDADFVHIWNNYYPFFFDKTGTQFTNNFNDFWTRNVLCLGYYTGSTWNKIYCVDELENFNRNIHSDNETYVNATLWKDIAYGAYDLRLAINYYLELNDENLTINLYTKNIGIDIPYDIGFVWRVTDINVWDGEENDKILVNNTEYWLNNSLDLSFTDLDEGYFNIFDDVTKASLWLRWNKNLPYKLQIKSVESQYNAPVSLGINVGQLDAGDERRTTMYWLDDKELNSVSLTSPANLSAYTPDDTFSFSCALTFGSGSASGTGADGNWSYCSTSECDPKTLLTDATSDLTGSDADGLFSVSGAGTSTTTVTAHDGGTYRLRCGATDNDGSPTFFSQVYTITVSPYGWLNVSIDKPDDDLNWYEDYTNLTINATVFCAGEANSACGSVYARARYNVSATTPDTKISTGLGADPFFVYDDGGASPLYLSEWSTTDTAQPIGIYSNDSHVWINDWGAFRVYRYEIDGDYLDSFDTSGYCARCHGITFNGSHFFISEFTTDDIYMVELDGTYVTEWDTAGDGGSSLYGISSNGTHLWVVDSVDGVVYKYHDNSTYIGAWDLTGTDVTNPISVATDGESIWVTNNTGDAVITRYTMGESYIDEWYVGDDISGLYGITSNGSHMYALDYNVDEVDIYYLGTQNQQVSSETLELGESFDFSWMLNVTTADTEGYLIDVFFNSSLLNANVPDNDTDNKLVNLNPSVGDLPEVNYTCPLGLGYIRFQNCSPDWEFYPSLPVGQDSDISAINATNNGTATGDFQIKYTGGLNNGWSLIACNASSASDPQADEVNCLNLTDSFQTILWSIEVDVEKEIWMYANCSEVAANPGVSIEMQAVA